MARSEDEVSSELEDEEVYDSEIDMNDDEDLPVLSDDEDNYNLEDPDEIDEDLELRDEEEDAKPVKKAVAISRQPRERKRVNYYENIDDEPIGDQSPPEAAEKPIKKLKMKIQRPEDLDPDLILTDEETEYNPANHKGRLTERQRNLEFATELPLDKPKTVKRETEEEVALRKAENARKRLDYKNKQLEEEKRDTLNKLLKRRATKVRDVDDDESNVEVKTLKPRRPIVHHPALVRYVNGDSASLSWNE